MNPSRTYDLEPKQEVKPEAKPAPTPEPKSAAPVEAK